MIQAKENKARLYNRQLDEILQLEKEGKVLILSPDRELEGRTFSRNGQQIKAVYDSGYRKASAIIDFLK